jgi:DNA repair exonuclease SbcCD ATPase subunit
LQIKHARLENIGRFKLFQAQFRKDQVNLLFGLGGAGKSVILRSIALCFGIGNRHFQQVGRMGRAGKIDIGVYPFGNHVFMTARQASLKTRLANAQCVLLDEPFDYLTAIKARRLVDTLRRMRKQVILASTRSYIKDAVPSRNTILISNQLVH